MAKIVLGKRYPIARCRTGLYSLDWALSDWRHKEGEAVEDVALGIPLRGHYEIHGKSSVGKSTLAYYLMKKVASTRIHLVDLEQVDVAYLNRVFDDFAGEVFLPGLVDEKKKPVSHEQLLGDAAEALFSGEAQAVMVDSVSALYSISEAEGGIGDANMGRRAKMVAQYLRKVTSSMMMNEDPTIAIAVNHEYQNMGTPGYTTAGGVGMQNYSSVRLRMWRKRGGLLSDESDHFTAGGETVKMRYGGRGGEFEVVCLSGLGVHPGMTALNDCLNFELVEMARGGWLTREGEKFGRRTEYLAAAAEGKDSPDMWSPFYGILHDHEQVLKSEAPILEEVVDE